MDQRCLSGQSCVALTEDGPAITYKPLCQRCVDDVQGKLDDLPKILRVLPAWKGGLRGEIGEARVSASKNAPPCPLNVEVLDIIMSIESILDRVRGRIADLVMQDGGPEWCDEIRWAHKAADKTIGISQHRSPRITPCGECGKRSLVSTTEPIIRDGVRSGVDIVRCESCGICMDLIEYKNLTLQMVAIEKKDRK